MCPDFVKRHGALSRWLQGLITKICSCIEMAKEKREGKFRKRPCKLQVNYKRQNGAYNLLFLLN
tara:strand:+ start:446 stop:637 length:192 start_codon:yes stop_codon:yes gene_type:complete